MFGTPLASYCAPDGSSHSIRVHVLGHRGSSGGALSIPVLAALLQSHGALVLDCDPTETRVLAELVAGEGLLAAQAVCDDYLPRARRATARLARPLEPEDLMWGDEDAPEQDLAA